MPARRKVVSGEIPNALEPARLRRAYERLRAAAIAGDVQGWRWGRSVLQRSGVAAWMRAWSDHARAEQEVSMNRQRNPPNPGNHTMLGAWGAAAGASLPVASFGAGTVPVDADAIVRLVAQLLRGVLDTTARAAATSVGVSA